MWKEYFYYSKAERRVLLFLMSVILLVLGIRLFLSCQPSTVVDDSFTRSDEMELFLASIEEKRVVKESKRSFTASARGEIRPVVFDPNLVDSTQLEQMGVPGWLAQRILNYRQAKGVFRTVESLKGIYGMPSDIFEKLKPYVVIADSFAYKSSYAKRYDTLSAAKLRYDSLRALKLPVGSVVDLNKADTTQLKMIPGIGSGIARMLVATREQLGGFYSLNQLEEFEFISAELSEWFIIEEPPTPSLEVNKLSLERLRRHPYLNFYQAKVIVEHCRKRGKIESLSQLSLYEEFTEKDLERLIYYLKFD
ncbi:MAG: helix-hairpin-helix domain-containing protein [Phocaeicola sp.]